MKTAKKELLVYIVAYGYSAGMIGTLIFGAIAGLFIFPVEPLWRYGVAGLAVSVCIWGVAIFIGVRKGYLEMRSLSDMKSYLFLRDIE